MASMRLRLIALHHFSGCRQSAIPSITARLLPLCRPSRTTGRILSRANFASKGSSISRTAPKPARYEGAALAQSTSNVPPNTLLYQAFSNRPYIVGSYIIGTVIIITGLFNQSTIAQARVFAVENRKQDLPSFVPAFTTFSSLFLVLVGCGFVFLKPKTLVQSIKLISPKASGTKRDRLLEIQRSSWLPFLKPNPLLVPPKDVTMSGPIWMGKQEQVQREIEKLDRKEQHQNAYSSDGFGGILTLPIRRAVYWLEIGMKGTWRACTNQNFRSLHVKGYNLPWKIDHRSSWALEEGNALDGMVNIHVVGKK